jgi:hypothetical protein
MSNKIANTCKIIPSELGAKQFFYPDHSSNHSLFVRKGTEVEVMNFVSSNENLYLQAVAISNRLVEGLEIQDGVSVYWVDRKNIS